MGLVLNHALSLSQNHGLSVVPIDKTLKHPPKGFMWDDYKNRIMTADEIRTFFGEYMRLGVIAGKVSRFLECIDFDEPGLYEQWRELLDNNGHDDLTKRLSIEKTPRGGVHVYYRCLDGVEPNQKLAMRPSTTDELIANPRSRGKARIETRGEGGLIVCVPSVGYEVIQGDLSKTPEITAEERLFLLYAAKSFNELFEEAPARERKETTGTHSDGKPGAVFNEKADWHDILTADGWRYLCAHRGRLHWTRPGKNERETSATTGNSTTDLLYVFTTSMHPLEPDTCYSKFGYVATMHHNGDYSVAAKDLRAKGYGYVVPNEYGAAKAPETAEMPSERAELPRDGGVEHPQRVWHGSSFSVLMRRPKKVMLVDGLIGEQDNFMIFGAPKSGKTFVGIDFMVSCVAGRTFATMFDIARPLTVAYLTNEGIGKLPDRLASCASHNGLTYESLDDRLIIYEDVPQLYQMDGPMSIKTFVRDWEMHETRSLDILMIDTLNKAAIGSDENSNSDAALISTNLLYARRRLGCATGLFHHSGRDGLKSRGASAYDGDMDVQLKVTNDNGNRLLAMSFAKDLEGFEDNGFKLTPVNESAAVTWTGSVEMASENDTVITQIVYKLRSIGSKELWTASQLYEALPHLSVKAIRIACQREVNNKGPHSLLRFVVEQDKGSSMWGLK